jgi:hypothetical protein
MRPSKQRQLEKAVRDAQSTLAKALAPEDICAGDFVAILHVVAELPSFLWCADPSTWPAREPVRIQFVPEAGGVPLRVKSVCLPFVLVKLPFGDEKSLDVRRCQLARLDRAYAKRAWKAHKENGAKRRFDWLER